MANLRKMGGLLLSVFCLSMPQAEARLGQVDVSEVAPDFPLEEIRRSVFCIREVGHKGFDQNCATASLVHSSGLIATAAHVVSHHASRDFEIATEQGKTFRVEIVWTAPSYDPNAGFLRDPQKLMFAEAKMRFGSGFRQEPVYDEIDPGVFQRADVALLRVIPEDLPALQATGAKPLALRTKGLRNRENLFLAGYTWTHYAGGFLDAVSKQMDLSEDEALKNTDGHFSVLTGLYHSTRGKLILTRASPAQEKGEDPGTDAIDSFSGSSGAPILDENGALVGIHSASDSSLGQFTRVRKSMVQLATSSAQLAEGFAALGVEWK